MAFGSLLAALLALMPVSGEPESTNPNAERAFPTMLVSHLDQVLEPTQLPVGTGVPLRSGVFVTITPQRLLIFDDNVATLRQGNIAQEAASTECKSGCPAVLYEAFEGKWLDLAIEAQALRLELPSRVLLAGDATVPAGTVIETAYAAAESRPVQPPGMFFVVHDGRAGVRMLPFQLLPPQGLTLDSRTAALGLTLRMDRGGYMVTAADPRFGRQLRAGNLTEVIAILRDIRKHYPGKQAIILVPGERTTLGELVKVMTTVARDFSHLVLSAGPSVTIR